MEVRDGEKVTITTKASAFTFFDSDSSLGTWKAEQSEASQGASVGDLQQSTSGTNAVRMFEAGIGAAVRAAIGEP